MRLDRKIIDLEDEVDRLRRGQGRHTAIIRPNRKTRYDNDLVSRRELLDYGYGTGSGNGAVGGTTPVFEDLTPNLTETGTSWALASAPVSADTVMLFLNGQKLRKVSATPSTTQYTISGVNITTGRSLVTGERLEAIYQVPGEAMAWEDLTPNLTETGTAWTLANTPDVDKLAVFLNGIRLRKVSATPSASQYTISGTTLTTGRSLVAGERLEVFYVY